MTDPTSEQIDEKTHIRISPSVYARPFGAELVLLEFGRGEYFGLDEIGAEVWRRLEAGDDLGATADHIAARYDVTRDVALRDILALVAHMRSQALVTLG